MKEIVSESFASPQIKVDDPQWYRACTLGERLASLQAQPVSRVGEQTIDQELAHKRLQRWQEQPAFQKGVDFAQRLNADHLSMDEFLTILGEPCEAIQQRVGVPGWMEDLATIFAGSDVPQFDETTTDDTKKLARLALIHIFDIFLL